MPPKWLEWSNRLAAIAQNGLTFCKDPFDIERYEQIRQLAAEIAADHVDADEAHVRELFTAEKGYATPKVDARGVVFQDDQLLLVKERADGLWTLPGGWVDVWESPGEAVEREVREESGYEVRAVKLLALIDRNKHGYPPIEWHIYKLFFRCELLGGEPVTSHETLDVGFFAQNAMPPLSMSRTSPEHIDRLFEHHAHPDWPTDFD